MDAQSRSRPFETFFAPERGNSHPALAVGSSMANSVVSKVPAEAAGKWWADALVNARDSSANLPVNQTVAVDSLIEKLNSDQLWVVNQRRRNGLIVFREFYAEFAGPGAAVGGSLDYGCRHVIPLGNLSLLAPEDPEEQQKALKIRLQWIRLTQNFTDQPRPADRAQMILEQFKTYFDQSTVDLVPDEAFAQMVGVLPRTIRRVRTGQV